MAKLIDLSNSDLKAIVDDEDFEFLSQWKWRRTPSGYAINGDCLRMHRVITKAPRGIQVDHISGDRLDNRRCNLRLATQSQNQRNKARKSIRQYGARYKGIFRCTETGRWRARLRCNGKNVNLGTHGTQEDAARAYDEGALEYFGDFARLNLPGDIVVTRDQKPLSKTSAAIPLPPELCNNTKRKAVKL